MRFPCYLSVSNVIATRIGLSSTTRLASFLPPELAAMADALALIVSMHVSRIFFSSQSSELGLVMNPPIAVHMAACIIVSVEFNPRSPCGEGTTPTSYYRILNEVPGIESRQLHGNRINHCQYEHVFYCWLRFALCGMVGSDISGCFGHSKPLAVYSLFLLPFQHVSTILTMMELSLHSREHARQWLVAIPVPGFAASCACAASGCVLSVLSSTRVLSLSVDSAGIHPTAVRLRVSRPAKGSHHGVRRKRCSGLKRSRV